MNLYKVSVLFLNLFIISFPLSVTMSQSFAFISLFLFIINSYKEKSLRTIFNYKVFILLFALYFCIFLSAIIHYNSYENFIKSVLKTEASYIWMVMVFIVAYRMAEDNDNLSQFTKSFFITVTFLILSGLISLFTEYRLHILVPHLFQYPEGARLQHFAGSILGLNVYLPIGFMNTHLTFGGLLGLCFPGVILFTMLNWKRVNIYYKIILPLLILLFLIIIFYNQSRSIWIGIIFVLFLISIKFRKNIFTKKSITGIIFIIIIFTSIGFYIYKSNSLIQRAFSESLAESTTENQRYYIYKNTLNFLSDNLLTGVGPGRFKEAHTEESNAMIAAKEVLWYELFITPRGHAHNDALHFWAVGGILPFLLYLSFGFYCLKAFYESEMNSNSVLFIGFITIYPASFLQCFFQDAEVLLPLYVFAAIFLAGNKNKISINYNLLSVLSLLIPFLLSMIYILYLVVKPVEKVFKRKIWTSHKEDIIQIRKSLNGDYASIEKSHLNEGFKVEGWLTHRFGNPPKIRKESFIIKLFIDPELKNSPERVKVRVYKRDAFDQDQMFKAHSFKFMDEYSYPLHTGNNILIFDKIFSQEESPYFPEKIYFRDFEFIFYPKNSNEEFVDLPKIQFDDSFTDESNSPYAK